MFWPPSSSGASSAAGGGDPAASVFDPNSFYNLGRCLQEQGQDEKDRYARGGDQLSESAPLPPTHRRDHGSDSLMLCSIRPQDVPPAGHRPFYDSVEDMNGPNEVRCRSMNDSMFMRQTRAGKMSGTLSPIISHSPPIPCYGAARRLDLSASPTGFSVSQIEGLVGGISSSSSPAASASSSFPATTTNLPPPSSSSSSSSFSVKNLVEPVWTPVEQIFGEIFSIFTGSKGLEDHETPSSASSSCSSSSKLSKEWCFVLGLALGFCCMAVLFPRTPVASYHGGGGGAYMPHYDPAGTEMYFQRGGDGGLIGWLASFGSNGSNGHSGLLNSPSSSAAATPTAPSPGLGLSNNRKSQYMMSKPVLSSPTPAPGPSNKNGESVPTSTGGFTAMLEAFLGTWTKTDTSEGIDSMVSEGRTQTFRLPSGREIVITLVKVSTGIWQVVTHALCGVLLALLRHLPFMPKNLTKSKQWC